MSVVICNFAFNKTRDKSHLTQHYRAGHQVNGELVVALEQIPPVSSYHHHHHYHHHYHHQIPPGLDVGDVVRVTDGLDLA